MSSSYYVTYGTDRLAFPGAIGSVAWEYNGETMVLLDPYRTSNGDYLKMRFVTPLGNEIILEDGSAGNVSASAMVPAGSTAYFTANGSQDGVDTRYHVTALANAGFSDVSSESWSNVTTAFYTNPNVETHGSAVLTSTGSASAQAITHACYKYVYGEGGEKFYSTVSASGFAPAFTGSWGTAAYRSMWIPRGSRFGFSASSLSGNTYSINPVVSADTISGMALAFNHRNLGTHSLLSGYADSPRNMRLSDGRQKKISAKGVFVWCTNTATTTWEPSPRITAFSSNLDTGTAYGTFIVGNDSASNSAGLFKMYGFASGNNIGSHRDRNGSWGSITTTNANYYFPWRFTQISNSSYASGMFSAKRVSYQSTTAAEYMFYGRSGGASFRIKNGTYKLAAGEGSVAKTNQTASKSLSNSGAYSMICLDSTVNTKMKAVCNCSGIWNGSARLY